MAFDPTLYETIPQTNIPGTLALMRATITASKPVASYPAAKKALKRVRQTGEALRTLYEVAPPAKTESVTRAVDAAMDRIWGAVEQRLGAYAEIAGDDGAEAVRVHGILFPNGLSFLTLKYPEQWAEGQAILGRIESSKLEASLERLVGSVFLATLRQRHAAYGDALGITKTKTVEPDAASLVEPLRTARGALATYVRVVAAAIDNGDLDEDVATSALAPVADLRQSIRSTKKKGEVAAAPAPVEPLPPIE